MERYARLQSLLCIPFRVPSEEVFPPGSLHRAPTERDTIPPEPSYPSLKVPGRRALPHVPQTGHGRKVKAKLPCTYAED